MQKLIWQKSKIIVKIIDYFNFFHVADNLCVQLSNPSGAASTFLNTPEQISDIWTLIFAACVHWFSGSSS